MKKTIKIATRFITQPNEVGEIIRETPKTVIVQVTKRTFNDKRSATGVIHKFTAGEREWFGGELNLQRRFWKESGNEIGGQTRIIR